MTAEQEVDFAAIRVGDKVKLRYNGLETPEPDWHEVIRLDVTGGIQVSVVAGADWYVAEGGPVAVIAHQPAPRVDVVEVTLGEPLTFFDRSYSDIAACRGCSSPSIVLLGVKGRFVPLTPSEARRLARDILATVGVDD
jgi:hypothetical protein